MRRQRQEERDPGDDCRRHDDDEHDFDRPERDDADSGAALEQREPLFLGERDLYPLLAASLSRYVPNQVRGTSVKIVRAEGTDGFWAGRGAKQRILVKLSLKGGKPPKLEAGRRGLRRAAQSAQGKSPILLGVKEKSGQRVLQNQGVYLLVSAGDLKLH